MRPQEVYEIYLDLIREGVFQFREDAEKLARANGLPTEPLNLAMVLGFEADRNYSRSTIRDTIENTPEYSDRNHDITTYSADQYKNIFADFAEQHQHLFPDLADHNKHPFKTVDTSGMSQEQLYQRNLKHAETMRGLMSALDFLDKM
jgi:hypothetical protein